MRAVMNLISSRIWGGVLLTALTAVPAAVSAAEPCTVHEKAGPRLARLEEAMAGRRFVTYQPTALQVIDGEVKPADADSIRADLEALRPWFDALVTYTARDGAERVPAIAKELGYRAVVLGVWSPGDPEELGNALAVARRYPDLVLGLSLGNEIVFSKRGTWENLRNYVKLTRQRAPDIPLTSTEPFAWFLGDAEGRAFAADLDFVLVNVHPVFEPWFRTAAPANWSDYVTKVTARLDEAFCAPVLVKETGTPTAPADKGFTPEMQAGFWHALEKDFEPTAKHAFSWFSAFDAPWREFDKLHPADPAQPEEAHWGLFTADRKPKPVIGGLKRLAD